MIQVSIRVKSGCKLHADGDALREKIVCDVVCLPTMYSTEYRYAVTGSRDSDGTGAGAGSNIAAGNGVWFN
jgi:hypothetical protein